MTPSITSVFRRFFTAALLAIPVHAYAADPALPAPAVESASHTAASEVSSTTIHISGMVCSSCERQITKSLRALPGVQGVTANHAAGTAVIEFDPKLVQLAQMEKAITDVGYSITPATESGISPGTPSRTFLHKDETLAAGH